MLPALESGTGVYREPIPKGGPRCLLEGTPFSVPLSLLSLKLLHDNLSPPFPSFSFPLSLPYLLSTYYVPGLVRGWEVA